MADIVTRLAARFDTPSLLTDELAQKVATLLAEFGHAGFDPQAFALAARRHGIGLVDPSRHRCWIDETVHASVLYRGRRAVSVLKDKGITS